MHGDSPTDPFSAAPLIRTRHDDVALAHRGRPGDGAPVVFVHGTLEDHTFWRPVIGRMCDEAPTRAWLTYDRRGHGASTDVPGQGTFTQDVDDLEALVRSVGGGRAHLVGHSYGATIAIALAGRAPELVASLFAFEPPLFGLLRDDPDAAPLLLEARDAIVSALRALEAGELEAGVELFIDRVAFGEGAWSGRMTRSTRDRMLAHVDTWIDQARDPERLSASPEGLATLGPRATLCTGGESLPTFGAVASALERRFESLGRAVIECAAHDAPVTHAEAFTDALLTHLSLHDG